MECKLFSVVTYQTTFFWTPLGVRTSQQPAIKWCFKYICGCFFFWYRIFFRVLPALHLCVCTHPACHLILNAFFWIPAIFIWYSCYSAPQCVSWVNCWIVCLWCAAVGFFKSRDDEAADDSDDEGAEFDVDIRAGRVSGHCSWTQLIWEWMDASAIPKTVINELVEEDRPQTGGMANM